MNDNPGFLTGGGEMGSLIRKYDWGTTALGSTEGWPQSLHTTLNILLHSKFPMFLFWGPEHICFYNDAYRPSLGDSEKHPYTLGKPGEQVWAEIWPIIKPQIDQVMGGGEATWHQDKAGALQRNGKMEPAFFTYSYSAVKDEADQVAGVFVTCIETTQAVRQQQQVQDNEERFRLMVDLAPNLVWMLDEEGSYKYVNETSLNYLGITQTEIATKGWAAYLHPDERERVSQTFHAAIAARKNYAYEHRLRTKNGEYRWVYSQAVPAYAADGSLYAYIGSSMDVHDRLMARQMLESTKAGLQQQVTEHSTELSETNKALQRTNTELQRSNQYLEEFAHAASHDLKEPIRKIQFFTQKIKEDMQDRMNSAELFSFSRIENAASRMGALIDDLLLYSEVSHMPMAMSSVTLNNVLADVLEDLDLEIAEKGATIEVGQLPTVTGYKRQLQQLFQNLIGNALKYSKAGEPPVIKITSDRRLVGEYQVIEVSDNGIGFDQQYADKIFQMFARLHGKSEYSGTGVGLSIVKKVVENHQGNIRVESQEGVGSVFKLYLPVTA